MYVGVDSKDLGRLFPMRQVQGSPNIKSSSTFAATINTHCDKNKPMGRREQGALSIIRCIRIAQIRAAARIMHVLNRQPGMASMLACLRRLPLVSWGTNVLAGYNRVFLDLPSAQAIARWYGRPTAGSAESAQGLAVDMSRTRPSDYPVLLHLSRLPLKQLRIFDLGGTTGDLFYLYGRYLDFPPCLRWTVYDLPQNLERGLHQARQIGESHLHFSDELYGASGHDVLLVSGALHYFDFELADYLAALPEPPRHVFINRTPLVDLPSKATVQYAAHRGVMSACRLLNRANLIAGLTGLGYELVDSWWRS